MSSDEDEFGDDSVDYSNGVQVAMLQTQALWSIRNRLESVDERVEEMSRELEQLHKSAREREDSIVAVIRSVDNVSHAIMDASERTSENFSSVRANIVALNDAVGEVCEAVDALRPTRKRRKNE